MKFFVDTANSSEIAELKQLGIVDGVTTNPSLIMKTGRNMREVVSQICEIAEGLPVSAEVVATDAEGMVREGHNLSGIASNVVVKVPLTWDGLKACRVLSDRGIGVNVTLCFGANQALLAAKAGARFISIFMGRLNDIGLDASQVLIDVRQILDEYEFSSEILAASLRSPLHVTEAALAGAEAITAPPGVLRKLADHPLTDKGLEAFLVDWEKTGQSIG